MMRVEIEMKPYLTAQTEDVKTTLTQGLWKEKEKREVEHESERIGEETGKEPIIVRGGI